MRGLSFFLFLLLCTFFHTPTIASLILQFSDIKQCAPFNVTFSAGKPPAAIPLTLTVLPFNSTPISIPISVWNTGTTTGATITFLPFAAGTNFIASLDDANGQSISLVSDVTGILPSNNTSCIPAQLNSAQPVYTVLTPVNQCQSFQVSFNALADNVTPSVRAFIPRNQSFFLNPTQDNRTVIGPPFKLANYEMTAPRGTQVVLLFDDGLGYHETSSLITVEGNVSSNTSCLAFFQQMSSNPTSVKSGLSSHAITAIAATISSVVGVVAVLMGVYAFRHRRRKLWNRFESDPSIESLKGFPYIGEKQTSGYLNLPYPVEEDNKSPNSLYFVQDPPSNRYSGSESEMKNPWPVRHSYRAPDTSSVHYNNPASTQQRTPYTTGLTVPRAEIKPSPEKIVDLTTIYSLDHSSRGSKTLTLTPESLPTLYSRSSPSVYTPSMRSMTGSMEELRATVSTLPIFGQSESIRSSRYSSRGNKSGERIVDGAWIGESPKVHGWKSSGTMDQNFRFPQPPNWL